MPSWLCSLANALSIVISLTSNLSYPCVFHSPFTVSRAMAPIQRNLVRKGGEIPQITSESCTMPTGGWNLPSRCEACDENGGAGVMD